jgi:hypothetical protein
MAKKVKLPRDKNQLAKAIVDIATSHSSKEQVKKITVPKKSN